MSDFCGRSEHGIGGGYLLASQLRRDGGRRSGVGKARTRPGHGFGDLRLVNSVLQAIGVEICGVWRLGEEEKCEIDGVEKRKKMVR
ncbi:hypothetical protein M0R45_036377 [Rubus argutus]|uniref:Uncharacterized protein n=1 Tax=Rubus argutus TaxID=59490 RepID=A0AAW1VXP7_RUBAR